MSEAAVADIAYGENQTQALRFQIECYDQETIMSEPTEDGGVKRYALSESQLRQLFAAEIVFRPEPGLIWMKDDGRNGKTYLFEMGKGPRTVMYVDRSGGKEELCPFKIQFPSMVFEISTSKDKIVGLQVWGHAGTRVKKNSTLYYLPLPNNVDGEGGMCMGKGDVFVFPGKLKEAVEEVFFECTYNNHHFLVGKERLPFPEFVKKYEGRIPFNKIAKAGKAGGVIRDL